MAKSFPIHTNRNRFDSRWPLAFPSPVIVRDGEVMTRQSGTGTSNPVMVSKFSKDCCCGEPKTPCQFCCTGIFRTRNNACCYSYRKVDNKMTGIKVSGLAYRDKFTLYSSFNERFIIHEEVITVQNGESFTTGFCVLQIPVLEKKWTFGNLLFSREVNREFHLSPARACDDRWFADAEGEFNQIFDSPLCKGELGSADMSRETYGESCKDCCLGWGESWFAEEKDLIFKDTRVWKRWFSFSYSMTNNVTPCDARCENCS